MEALHYTWHAGGAEHDLRLAPVPGTAGRPYLFGRESHRRPIEVRDFHMMSTPVTQALWTHVMGSNPVGRDEPRHPVTNVSWNHITGPGGFLDRINTGPVLAAVSNPRGALRFRLPSETEWEYAARGGPRWTDSFAFSGSDDVDKVAWYGHRFSSGRRLLCRVLGWRFAGRFPPGRPTHPHDVAGKAANQLGLYDMCGNVWEWCQDACTDDLGAVLADGRPWPGPGPERRLRGGSRQNWHIHCTVWFRYGITPDAHDGCIGFRPVLARA